MNLHPFLRGYLKGYGLTGLTLSPLIATILWSHGIHSWLLIFYFGVLTVLSGVATYLAYRR